ncbi:hypothetical protein [Xanthomonas sp. 10-10]|uniref:ApeA N-terminal domain-containing protein n=1 Tax=Xanthomonas sp. 10-10 TaxID=3115848 RepID=A0AAU7P805_9XANT
MLITVAFDVKNYVELMESWPVRVGDISLFIECEGRVVKKVCISYSNVGIENAPLIDESFGHPPKININGGAYVTAAIERLMDWQAVISGQQIFDLDFDSHEIRFRAENTAEDGKIAIKSFRGSRGEALNASLDFEQIGRAFLVDSVDKVRVESASHFREGRIAYAAGRHVDAYNNLYLFIETRYCDGKTGNEIQTKILSQAPKFVGSLSDVIARLQGAEKIDQIKSSKHIQKLFEVDTSLYEKIKILVMLRGSLRHHSFKNPHRWNPNKQQEYEAPARFLSLVVGEIVLSESINDIYNPDVLKKFRDISIGAGFETSVRVSTRRLDGKAALVIDLSVPTTVASTRLCLKTLRDSIGLCKEHEQLAATTRIEATANGLELFIAEVGIWAYNPTHSIKAVSEKNSVRCSFEYMKAGVVITGEFNIPIQGGDVDVWFVWNIFLRCFEWIENRDPTTRVVNMKIFLNKLDSPVIRYAVGAQVRF